MRRTPIVVAAAVLLALGACGGGGGGKKAVSTGSSPTTMPAAANGDAMGTTPSSAAPAAAAASPAAAAATPATAKPGAGAATATTAHPATPAPTASQTPPPASGNSTGPTYAGKPTTASGHYSYAVSGTSSFGSPPPKADLVVDAPQGSTQHSKVTTQTQQGSSSTDTTLDYQPDGVHLVDLSTQSGSGSMQFHPNPAPLIFPASFAKGATVGPFDMTSSDGKEKATVTVTIQDTNVSVTTGDGAAHPTVQVQVDTTLSCAQPGCALTGTLHSTRWIDYDGLQVKSHDTSDVTFQGTYKFTSDTVSLVDKTTPS